MSKRPTIKGKSLSQELANRNNVPAAARKSFVGRADYQKRKPEAPKGLGNP